MWRDETIKHCLIHTAGVAKEKAGLERLIAESRVVVMITVSYDCASQGTATIPLASIVELITATLQTPTLTPALFSYFFPIQTPFHSLPFRADLLRSRVGFLSTAAAIAAGEGK